MSGLALASMLVAGSCRENTGPTSTFALAWSSARTSAGGDWVNGAPAVDGGRLFIQEGNNLVGLDAVTGKRIWSRRIRVAPFPGPSTLRAADGHVYVSETDSLMAVDAATGATIWTVHPDSQAIVETALDGDTFYSGQRGVPVVYALSRSTGAVRWKVNVGPGYALAANVGGVSVSGDTVYVSVARNATPNGGFSSGVLVALDRRDGRELWRYETPVAKHRFLDAPVPVAGRVLVNDVGVGDVAAIDIATRREVWRTAVGAAIRVRVSGQTVFTGGNDHAFALDLATGAVRWTKPTGSSAFGIGVCQGNLFVSAFALRRFEGATGELTGEIGSQGGYVSHVASDGIRAFTTGEFGAIAVYCGAPPG